MFSCEFVSYLQNSYFDKYLWRTTSANFNSTCLPYFSIQIHVKFGLFSNIFLNSSITSSERPRWYLIKSLSKCCFNWYVAFSFEIFFYNKTSFFFWYLTYCNVESPPQRYFRMCLQAFFPLSYLINALETHCSFATSRITSSIK